MREVGDDTDKRAPGGSEREGERWRVGPAGLGFSGPDGKEGRERERREVGWAGLGWVRGKVLFFLTQTPFEDSRRFEDDGRR